MNVCRGLPTQLSVPIPTPAMPGEDLLSNVHMARQILCPALPGSELGRKGVVARNDNTEFPLLSKERDTG